MFNLKKRIKNGLHFVTNIINSTRMWTALFKKKSSFPESGFLHRHDQSQDTDHKHLVLNLFTKNSIFVR